ncbi:AsnC family transcriptional regulator [Streptomyces sp. MUM 203J]|uniref:AsnC family transcriptional regulator n=1 Tax=Streptomyces sp. MUM 203J TaxID=2791990 RepID=UPI001F03C90D|nr:AsnC family transcriptional regulator [Streptomyces sp. MUM 203J]MCH0539985.1 AsnC family transcriptional regulator [Streptomyces sp. MUM 203J]
MADTSTVDQLDRQLLHALQLDGRARFRRIAPVLGVSEHTVARRYRRLRAAGLQLAGEPDPERLGRTRWLLRLRCAPDAAPAIADALARRPDTGYVSLASGGTELHCSLSTGSAEEDEEILLRALPRTPRIISLDAHCFLHTFAGDPPSWYTKLGSLTPGQHAALLPPHDSRRPLPDPGPPPPAALSTARPSLELDHADRLLLDALARDARATLPELEAATGLPRTTVRRRLDRLRDTGAVRIAVAFPPARVGYRKRAVLWLRVSPGAMQTVGETLSSHPQTDLVAATTGPANLVATVICRDATELYLYLNHRIGALPDIQSVEATPVIREVKRLTRRGTP